MLLKLVRVVHALHQTHVLQSVGAPTTCGCVASAAQDCSSSLQVCGDAVCVGASVWKPSSAGTGNEMRWDKHSWTVSTTRGAQTAFYCIKLRGRPPRFLVLECNVCSAAGGGTRVLEYGVCSYAGAVTQSSQVMRTVLGAKTARQRCSTMSCRHTV